MKQSKLQIGQPIFLKPIGNMARNRKRHEIIEAEVGTVGKKYFTVKKGAGDDLREYGQFHMDSLLQNLGQYSSNYQGYLSEQAILDEQELKLLLQNIRTHVGTAGQSNLSLNQCRAISKIIKDGNV